MPPVGAKKNSLREIVCEQKIGVGRFLLFTPPCQKLGRKKDPKFDFVKKIGFGENKKNHQVWFQKWGKTPKKKSGAKAKPKASNASQRR